MTDLVTVINQTAKAKEIYESLWLGQYGSYKASDRGNLNKLDVYETMFLIENGMLRLTNINKKKLIEELKSRHSHFSLLYSVYKDWRQNGYVVKTGFKFGTHFRIYFPGAKPFKAENGDCVTSGKAGGEG